MSQPVDTQDCVSSDSPTRHSETTTQLSLGLSDQPESNRSTPSVFVQLRTSPRKRQPVDRSSTLSEEQEMKDTNSQSQTLFDTQSQESTHSQLAEGNREEMSKEEETQGEEVLIPPKNKKSRPSIESQDSVHSQAYKDPPAKHKLKQKVLPDGRIIHYACIQYCDEHGKVLYTEHDEVDSTQGSSGYAADHSSSGTSSGTSHNSQDLILKAHRSAEDSLFLSPQVPLLKKSNSIPLPFAQTKPTGLAPLPSNHAKVLISQQRRSILAAVNGNKTRHSRDTKPAVELSPPACLDTSQPNSTNISGVSAILAEDGLTHGHVHESSADTLPAHTDSIKDARKSGKHVLPAEAVLATGLDEKSKLSTGSTSKLACAPSHRTLRRRKRSKSTSSKGASTTARPVTKRPKNMLSSHDSSSSALPYGRSARNLPPPNHKELVVGARVIAKWPTDSYYYFGMVVQKDRAHWQVLYDDGNNARVNGKDLLVIQTIPKRHPILAKRPASDEYVPATVIDNQVENQYLISLLNEAAADISVSSKDICLDYGQFKNLSLLLTSQQSSTSEVESNVERDFSYVDRRSIPAVTAASLVSTSTPVLHPQPAVMSAKKAKIYTDVQKSPLKGTSRRSGETVSATASCALKFGETSTSSLNVYNGFVFMVTSLAKDKLINEVMNRLGVEEDSQSQSQADTSDELEATADEETISAKIEALGGLVIDKYDGDAVAAAKRCFLISSGFRRTLKYLQCLAANIPPVSHRWVEHCFNEKKFLSESGYLLPSGVNSQGSIVEWGLRTTTKPTPLKGVSILLSTIETGTTFIEDWTCILKVAQAIVVKKISVASGIKPDYIMTNAAGCTKTHCNQAKRLDIPIVLTEWAIQLLINSKAT